MNEYLTLDQAAKVLGVKPETVRNHVYLWEVTKGATGLRPYREDCAHDRHILFLSTEVEAWNAERWATPIVREALHRLVVLARKRGAIIAKAPTVVYRCPLARQWHQRNARFYCHTHHPDYPPNTICCVHEVADLPRAKLYGILAHELGHLYGSGQQWPAEAEIGADEWVEQVLGMEILYDPADSLEFLAAKDMAKLR